MRGFDWLIFLQGNLNLFIGLELQVKASQLTNDGQYEEASRIYTEIIDECKASNPLYKYKRAKCYYQMGDQYLNAARADLHKIHTYCMEKTKEASYILRMKVFYTSALWEISFGCDIRRVELLLKQFLEIIEKFNIHQL